MAPTQERTCSVMLVVNVNVAAAIFAILCSFCVVPIGTTAPSYFLDWTHPDNYSMHVMLAGLQDDNGCKCSGSSIHHSLFLLVLLFQVLGLDTP